MEKIYEILSIITAFQLFFFGMILLLQKKGHRLSHWLLAIFFFAKSLAIVDILTWMHYKYWHDTFPHIFMIGWPYSFLFGPSLYLFTKSRINKGFSLTKKDLLHLIPFAIHFFYLVIVYYRHDTFNKQNYFFFMGPQEWFFIRFFDGLMHIQALIYMILSLKILYTYGLEIKNWFSNIHDYNLNWLRIVLFGFISMWILHLTDYIIILITGGESNVVINLCTKIIMFLFSTFVIYKGLTQTRIYTSQPADPDKVKSEVTKTEDYKTKLNRFMTDQKPHLNSSITITELSDQVKIPVRELSKLLNESYDKNFFDFINSYRIEEAKKLLVSHQDKKITILEILYEAGFNSKSVFNTVFKKQTGMTPTEYKKKTLFAEQIN